MKPVAIIAASRTPIGSFQGSLSSVEASELGATAIRSVLSKSGLSADQAAGAVDDVIMGHVLSAGQGQNTARQAAMAAGIAHPVPSICINQVCGSGLRAVAMAAQSIIAGDAEMIIAGGQESMSLSAHTARLRAGQKMGDLSMVDTMIKDGLWCAFESYHMGVTAENVAKAYDISREAQDAFALASQQKASAARANGKFVDEICPVTVRSRRSETIVDQDEYIRDDASAESLSRLRAAFEKDGTVTAGNASGLNDGAAALMVSSEDFVNQHNLKPLAWIKSWATAGVEPSLMGTGPIPASQKALSKAGWSVSDLDLVESNEAFAAQSLAVMKALELDPAIVNVNGGAIALGHPIGASGARVLVTLVHEMQKQQVSRGLATLCIGGGMGVAMCLERG
ncbi:MAG: acetyl-CoA C-acetyltransferase [Alphaproteobacteria bacterium]